VHLRSPEGLPPQYPLPIDNARAVALGCNDGNNNRAQQDSHGRRATIPRPALNDASPIASVTALETSYKERCPSRSFGSKLIDPTPSRHTSFAANQVPVDRVRPLPQLGLLPRAPADQAQKAFTNNEMDLFF
jgi:hypothetical protein